MSSPKQIVQIAKDVAAAVLFIISSGLTWWYTHKLIVSGIIIALAVDFTIGMWAMIEKKYTLADMKDFWGIICLMGLITFTLYSSDATKNRLIYCIIFGTLGLIDGCCVVAQFTKFLPMYTILLLPDVNIDESVRENEGKDESIKVSVSESASQRVSESASP